MLAVWGKPKINGRRSFMRAAVCHHCDIIGHMTIRLSIDDFLYVLSRN